MTERTGDPGAQPRRPIVVPAAGDSPAMLDLARYQALAVLAEEQFGQFTASQAEGAGAGAADIEALLDAQLAERVIGFAEVYRIRAGARHQHPWLLAAWLSLDPARPLRDRSLPGGVACRASAAELYQDGGRGVRAEFIVPGGLSHPVQDVVIYDEPIGRDDWTRIEGLPVTGIGRTLCDEAIGWDPGNVESLALSMIRRTSRDRVLRDLHRYLSGLPEPTRWQQKLPAFVAGLAE
ncbi:hypothetical protein [Longispora albida]|uniref:hypothetical protein n=1 Tax=Longispora albida TaxID=203523 RepID=UPI000379D936|nr:hypothetical protein [Longispora albida]